MVRDTEVMRVDSSGTNRSEVWAEAGRSSSLPRSEHMTLQTVMKKEGGEEYGLEKCRGSGKSWKRGENVVTINSLRVLYM